MVDVSTVIMKGACSLQAVCYYMEQVQLSVGWFSLPVTELNLESNLLQMGSLMKPS
jgi:hypothetical protein